MDESELVNQLSQFGLSETEARAYITILRNGSTKISTVSSEADLSKSYTYELISNLESRNLVEVDDHVVPARVHATHPSEGIKNLRSELETVESQLTQIFSNQGDDASERDFRVIKSRQTLFKKISKLIENAELEVNISTPVSALDKFEESLRDAHERDVFSLCLLSSYDSSQLREPGGLAHVVRTWNAPAPIILTVDRSFGLIASPEVLFQSNPTKYAIYHAEQQIVSTFFDSFIANYWPIANQEHVSEPSEFPKTYGSFRHAVFDATLQLFDQQTIDAELEIRPTTSSEPFESVSAGIISVEQSLVRPATNRFPTQESLTVEWDGGTHSVGGPQAFLEEFEAQSVTFLGKN